ncbi:hypothetical protein SAMD00023353_0303480 [Rosellinia necatrix]|uniref:BZIP domain-containing protein n=1 Tax=Rosellinia necatrix TaxID=77044 RepID=A0A1W2TDX7_ROSNE|nr:hypothetical protein SAMD00023353_0303480 [Rosellinia necatrix]
MEAANSPPSTSDGQARKRKSRNSDVRKEQNRIASRAYREKRRQKLALLDEILKSDSHTDSMSSVSDETEYSAMTPAPAPEFRAAEPTSAATHSPRSPAPYYMSAGPRLASMSAGIQTLPSSIPSRDAGGYVSYSVRDYSQEPERLTTHTDYACDPNIATMGLSSGYVSPLPSVASMSSAPMFPFDEEAMGGPFSAYPPLEVDVSGFPAATPGCDSDMINALQSLSRLNDNQQQQIVAYLQKKINPAQSTVADHPFHLGHGGYHVPVQRSNLLLGMKPSNTRGFFKL